MLFNEPIFTFIERRSSDKWFLMKAIFFCVISIIFLSTPKLFVQGLSVFETEWWEAVLRKKDNLLDPLTDIDPSHHAAKKVFRLTVPLLAKALNLSALGIYLFQMCCGIALLWLIFKLILRDTHDKVVATLVMFGTSWVYFGKACFVDILSTFDGVSFLLLLCAMYSRKTGLIFLSTFLAAWNDERAFLSLAIVLLYHQFIKNHTFNFRLSKHSSAVLLGGLFYLISRIALSILFNMHTPNGAVGLGVFFTNLPLSGIGIWTALEGFWILILYFLIHLFKEKEFAQTLFFVIFIGAYLFLGLLVFDITRGESYFFPFLFVVVPFLYQKVDSKITKNILVTACLISFIFPAYAIIGPGLTSYQPILFDFMYYLRGHLM